VNRIWGASRAPPWGWIVNSLDHKPEGLNAILRDAGGLQGLAVQLGQGDPNAFEPEQPMRTCQAIADAEAAASEPTGLSAI
jgi:hypothetical protein